jgi:hypothetical protein
MVTFAFYKGKGKLVNALIRLWTRGPYSHTEVITTQNGSLSYCYSADRPDKGIRGKWRLLDAAEWDFVQVDADPVAVAQWYEDRIGCGYDFMGLLGFVWRPETGSKNKYFCSEANAASIGINEAWRLDPNTLKPIIDNLSNYTRN